MRFRTRCCCVPGCLDIVSKQHVIAKNEACRKIWLERINNKKLFSPTANLTSYRICESHFEADCFVAGKLNKIALPTLNLKDYVKTENDYLFNPPSPKGRVTPTKIRELLQLPPATLYDSSPVGTVKKPVFTYSKRMRIFDVDEQPVIEQADFGEKECRTCLKVLTEENSISLEKEVVAEITILEALKKLADIQVPETDPLPQQICEKCFSNLQTAINFSRQVKSSDEKLKSKLPLLTDPLVIKPEPLVIKTEELNILDDNVNKPLENIVIEEVKMEVLEENIEKFASSETADQISNANAIEVNVNCEKEPIVDNYRKKKYLYKSTLLFKTCTCRKPKDNSSLCPECGKIFKTRISCQSHIKRTHFRSISTSDNACLCPKCGKMFHSREGCQKHIKRSHTGLKKKTITNYLCPNCGQFISGTRKKLLGHMAKYHSNKTRSKTTSSSCLCPECGKMFKTKQNCTVHLRKIHGKNMAIPRKKNSLCPDCGRSISGSKQKFLAHLALHQSNKIS